MAERFERLLLERLVLVELGDFVTQRLRPILGIEAAAALTGVLSRLAERRGLVPDGTGRHQVGGSRLVLIESTSSARSSSGSTCCFRTTVPVVASTMWTTFSRPWSL